MSSRYPTISFTDDLYFRNAQHANDMAQKLAQGISRLGYEFMTKPVSNQIFPIFPNGVIRSLEDMYEFYVWQKVDENRSAIRLVTSWATPEVITDQFLTELQRCTT